MNLEEFLKNNTSQECPWLTRRVELMDGFTISIQASEYHYSEPRKNLDDKSLYYSFELGFPSEQEYLIKQFAEDPDSLTDTVYPYVPKDVVESMIEKHGGIKGSAAKTKA